MHNFSAPSFSSYFHLSEEAAVQPLFEALDWSDARAKAVQERAKTLVSTVRDGKKTAGQLEIFMRDYSLNSEEGLALMTLAEALLRIPDRKTAQALINDKVAASDWLKNIGSSDDWLVKAAGVGLFMTSKTLNSVLRSVGEPVIREAMVRAMQILGKQFVLGPDIEAAYQNAQPFMKDGYRMSYDILGEGARTAIDAQNYFDSYFEAIQYVANRVDAQSETRPGISVKLSALHPRYEFAQEARCVPEMTEKLRILAEEAAKHDLTLTVDAEESERLNLSLQIFEGVLSDASLGAWEGFGLAIQAYMKSAPHVIDHVVDLSKRYERRLQVRLIKGAYWDSEIKQAQVEGHRDFPVYTRKAHTDLAYLACAAKLLAARETIYPMFGTHNAHSIAAVLEMAGDDHDGFEFQRLFGMGRAVFGHLLKEGTRASIYAPVGPHKDLLPYLVRRLLENGANSSFVNRILDPDVPVEELVADPVEKAKSYNESKHPKIALPDDIFQDEPPQPRANSKGMDLNAPEEVAALYAAINDVATTYQAEPIIGGQAHRQGVAEDVKSPTDFMDVVGRVYNLEPRFVDTAFDVATTGYVQWSAESATTRAHALRRAADILESRRDECIGLLVREAGKTIPDAVAEIREAVDFLRYYANQGELVFQDGGAALPGPTGESNRLLMQGRGVFVCISPWNFPLAIFTGQIAAALMAGNAVLAKPAEQTPLIAAVMVKILHEAGVHQDALNLITGDGRVGAQLVAHPQVAGVAFTGSTSVAREINITLAQKEGPIVPLIAETGGQNAMIVDSSALPEQVIDDVILSAFGSAGQRCSALRVLCVQDDVADTVINMLRGAMKELHVGDPMELSSDLGPVIDEDAKALLRKHREALSGFGELVYEVPLDIELAREGHFFGPCAYQIQSIRDLKKEVFGPILHVLRFKSDDLPDVLQELKDTGFGLTFGVHSRLQSTQETLAQALPVGNVYVNRSMTGAVVGSQPFGGQGLSGTGPKAGGPHYLYRFATERVISIDTTAAGGNASLVSLEE